LFRGQWVFDDPAVGLRREAFVAGADTMLDRMTVDIPFAGNGVLMIFSASDFPGADHKFTRVREEQGGNWYHSEEYGADGWLCPALFKYFDTAPAELYVKVSPIRENLGDDEREYYNEKEFATA